VGYSGTSTGYYRRYRVPLTAFTRYPYRGRFTTCFEVPRLDVQRLNDFFFFDQVEEKDPYYIHQVIKSHKTGKGDCGVNFFDGGS
jgi:hypothetical protein